MAVCSNYGPSVDRFGILAACTLHATSPPLVRRPCLVCHPHCLLDQSFLSPSLRCYPLFLRRLLLWHSWRSVPAQHTATGLVCSQSCLEEPPWAGAHAYDATMLVARAWASLGPSAMEANTTMSVALLRAIRSTRFEGASGNVSLHPDTGETADGAYEVVQWRGDLHLEQVGLDSSSSLALQPASLFFPGVADGGYPPDGGEADAAASSLLDVSTRVAAVCRSDSTPCCSVGRIKAHVIAVWIPLLQGQRDSIYVVLSNIFGSRVPAPGRNCSALTIRVVPTDSVGDAAAISPEVVPVSIEGSCRLSYSVPLGMIGSHQLVVLLGSSIVGSAEVLIFGADAERPQSDTSGWSWVIVLGVCSAALMAVALTVAYRFHKFERLRRRSAEMGASQHGLKEVLALFSNPQLTRQAQQFGLRPLSFGKDIKHLLRQMDMKEIAIVPAATLIDAQDALDEHRPRIVIFSGHTFMGSLAFEDDDGRMDAHSDPFRFEQILLGQVRPKEEAHTPTGHHLHLSVNLTVHRPHLQCSSRDSSGHNKPDDVSGCEKKRARFSSTCRPLSPGSRLASQKPKSEAAPCPPDKAATEMTGHMARVEGPSRGEGGGSRGEGGGSRGESSRSAANSNATDGAAAHAQAHPAAASHSEVSVPRAERLISSSIRPKEVLHRLQAGHPSQPDPHPHQSHPNHTAQPVPSHSTWQCVVLNGCQTEAIGRHMLLVAPTISVVCWSTLAEDNAARAFSAGFYESVHQMLAKQRQMGAVGCCGCSRDGELEAPLRIDEAFRAGCGSFLSHGFRFGDPAAYLHPPGHSHHYRPDYQHCLGCTPPVHGDCLLLTSIDSVVQVVAGSKIFATSRTHSSCVYRNRTSNPREPGSSWVLADCLLTLREALAR